jgi:hypothetical protein
MAHHLNLNLHNLTSSIESIIFRIFDTGTAGDLADIVFCCEGALASHCGAKPDEGYLQIPFDFLRRSGQGRDVALGILLVRNE